MVVIDDKTPDRFSIDVTQSLAGRHLADTAFSAKLYTAHTKTILRNSRQEERLRMPHYPVKLRNIHQNNYKPEQSPARIIGKNPF
jgi:hypothetical protein